MATALEEFLKAQARGKKQQAGSLAKAKGAGVQTTTATSPLGGPVKGIDFDPNTQPLPAPPIGSYDSAIDYNAGAAQRGYDQTFNDAQTGYERGQQDYGVTLDALGLGRDRNLEDLGTSKTRGLEDYGFQTSELGRNYGILGRQQAEGAAQRGVTSAGLLGKSAAVRGENQGRDQGQLDLGRDRMLQDFTTQTGRVNKDYDLGKQGLDLGFARQWGGFNGTERINPLTGKAEIGDVTLGVTRAGGENTAYQTAAGQQRIQQAQAGGFISPLLNPVNTPITPAKAKAFKKKQGI